MKVPRWLMADPDAPRPTVAGEAAAALTTFLTMAYILVVNPGILGGAIQVEGVPLFGELLAATALAAAVGCVLMGLLGRHPFALAPGMGLNAYFAFEVVGARGVPWETALGAVFLSGLLFLALSLTGIRALVARAIPKALQHGVVAGIGLFLLHLGLQGAGLVVDHPATLVTLGDVTQPGAWLTLVGLAVMVPLQVKKRSWALLAGMAAVTLLAIGAGLPAWQGQAFAAPAGGWVQAPAWPTHLLGALDIQGALGLGLLDIVFVFLFVDFFDTTGTVLGLARKTGALDDQGGIRRPRGTFAADALATSIGALFGTSTTTAYIESAAGVDAGGRSGLTAIFTGVLFLLALALWPLLSVVPAAATAPVLVLVGISMLGQLRHLDPDDLPAMVSAGLAAVAMPLTYSISHGISAGILAWAGLHLLSGRWRAVHPVMAALAGVLVLRYGWMAAG
jgi:AGZA family xanthine/uracil permease-like MFS transporter